MAEVRTIKIDADAKAAIQEMGKLGKSFEDVLGEVKPLNTQIGEMEDALYELVAAGEAGSDTYNKLAGEIAAMKKIVIETDMEIDSMATTTSQKLGGSLAGVTSGFELGTGAMAVFGQESQAVEEMLLKVNAAMAISQGVQGIREAIPSFKALGKQVAKYAVTTKGLTLATNAQSVAQAALNVVMNLNPVFLLVTGFAALAGAFIYFSTKTKEAEELNNKLNKTLEEQNRLVDEHIAAIQKRADHKIKMLELEGASEETLHDANMKRLEIEEQARKVQMDNLRSQTREKAKILEKAIMEGNEELAGSIADEIEANKQKFKELEAMEQDYLNNVEIANQEWENRKEEMRKEEIEKEKANYQERLAKWKEYQQNRLNAERQIDDLRLSNMEEGFNKEAEILNTQFERFKADTLANEALLQDEKNALIEQKTIEHWQKMQELEAAMAPELHTVRLERLNIEEEEKGSLLNAWNNLTQEQITASMEEANSSRFQTFTAGIEQMENASRDYFQATQDGLNAMSALNDLLTDQAVRKANGNARAEEAARKKGFERGKKIQLASAVITGIQGVMAAFTAGSSMGPAGVVMGPLMAALAAVMAGVNTAKIANTRYESPSGSGAATPAAPSAGGAGSPSFNVVGAGGANQLAESLGQDQEPVRAYVVSEEVTSQQSLDRNRQENASL